MIKELFLLTGALASVTTPEIIAPKIFTCEQNGTYGYDYAVTNVLGQYNGYAMSLDFDPFTDDWYNPYWRTNPTTDQTLYDFNFTFDLSNYIVDEHTENPFPYYIMSFNGGTNWQALSITDDLYSFTIRNVRYQDLEDIRIMYAIEYGSHQYYRLDNWKVTFWQPSAFIEYENEAYDVGYEEGYNVAWNGAKDYYYDVGYEAGHTAGYQEGEAATFNDSGITTMLGAIIDYPVNFLRGLFNFELFGVNIFSLLTFAFTLTLIVWVIRRFKK